MYTDSRRPAPALVPFFIVSALALSACQRHEPARRLSRNPRSPRSEDRRGQIAADYLRAQIAKISSDEFEARADDSRRRATRASTSSSS